MQTNNFVRNVQDIVEVCDIFRFPTLTEQRELVQQRLAIEKRFGDNVLFKYHRNVMYDYAWNKSKHLMECRGHVYSNTTGELLVAPPRKSFNYLENDWWKDVPLDAPVFYAKKYNGFLACVSTINDEIVYTTTGSLDSTFTGYAEEMLAQDMRNNGVLKAGKHVTYHTEVIHPDDPHIVAEEIGYAHLAYRTKSGGMQAPRNLKEATLGEVLELVKHDRGEGFMVYHAADYNSLSPCKIKTPYYVGKKKLMRMQAKQIDKMFDQPGWSATVLPYEWRFAIAVITKSFTREQWKALDAQQRRNVIEENESFYFAVQE